jgi:2-amino-4-hydroxy-6-hydroxymethyldihydropteridine diphosphokinase
MQSAVSRNFIMNSAYLLTGGNLGERHIALETAAAYVAIDCGRVTTTSSIYETEPWGNRDQPAFLNQVLQINTSLSARELLNRLLCIEEKMGRKRKEKYGPRLIDIDLLFFNSDIIRLPHLHVPHPEMLNRKFVMKPLAEIAPEFVHPVYQLPMKTLVLQCQDKLYVKKFLR